MSWMATLYKTYEQALELEGKKPWPLSHMQKQAHIEIVLNGDGKLKPGRISVLPGEAASTLIPVTEASAGRTRGIAPHPLCEELGYCTREHSKEEKERNTYDLYIKQIKAWQKFDSENHKLNAIVKYLESGRLWSDLSSEIQFPISFKTVKNGKSQSRKIAAKKCFIRWRIEIPGIAESGTWEDDDLIQSWIAYDQENNAVQGYCFVDGERKRISQNHPKFLRFPSDGAKLVSSNDKDGYTFRGRFTEAEQAANVSFEVTQKAHNALRWLIGERKQVYRNGDQVVVIWAISGKETPSPFAELPLSFDEPFELNDAGITDNTDLDAKPDISVGLGQQHGIALQRYMKGYYQNFEDTPNESVIIMGLDSATTGRMAITYYRDFMAMDYLDMTNRWYQHLAWPQRVVKEYINSKGKKYTKVRWWPGTPTPWAIMNCCYGDIISCYGDIIKSNESLKKQVIERLLPCIVENKPIPEDLLRLAARRASNPNSGEQWEWERNLGVACALYRGFHHPDRQPDPTQQRNYDMALDLENTSRDYLFGRLLAIADKIERVALSLRDENRPTASQRLMQRFADRPSSTWLIIHKQLVPYQLQLRASRPGFLTNREKELDAVTDLFRPDDFTRDAPLSAEYLLGFHSQRLALRPSEQQDDKPTDQSTDSSTQED